MLNMDMEAEDILTVAYPNWGSSAYTSQKSPTRQESGLLQLLSELRNPRGSNRFCGKLPMKVPGKTLLRGRRRCAMIYLQEKKIWELNYGRFYKNLLKANTGDMSSFLNDRQYNGR